MFPLGSGTVPDTAVDLDQRLAGGLQQILRPEAGEIGVHSRLGDGDAGTTGAAARPIAQLDLDLTGVRIGVREKDEIAEPAEESSLTRVDRLTLRGEPVTVQEVPVTVSAEVENLPVRYRRREDGQWWFEADDRADDHRAVSGRVEASSPLADLEGVVSALASERLAATGFTLTDLRLRVIRASNRRAEIEVDVALRRGILRASVTGTATASVGTDMVVTLADLEVTSTSPLVSMALPALRGRLARWEGHQVDLGAFTFGGATVRDVELIVTETTVGVRAEIGG
ncbi:hypothetical protein [Ruania halotolerans]|uniref:hypothetical protein n=1 Tax=Ruania halotolerans TaxID=2897773 RepID=UPI001E394D32|nr:hypothetical protein [Ruania halotolerans]UFU08226.1 hypothetical protein LQF10_09080 [Ruania halotolerans]